MPCSDFVLKKPNPEMCGFQEELASLSDGFNGMRIVLVQVLNMTAEEACTYSLHGFQHVIITAGMKLKDPMPRDQQLLSQISSVAG